MYKTVLFKYMCMFDCDFNQTGWNMPSYHLQVKFYISYLRYLLKKLKRNITGMKHKAQTQYLRRLFNAFDLQPSWNVKTGLQNIYVYSIFQIIFFLKALVFLTHLLKASPNVKRVGNAI